MISTVVIISIAVFIAGHVFYGRYLSKQMGLDDSRQTPACRINDGIDYVPAKPALLLRQHFSAIAAAGTIGGRQQLIYTLTRRAQMWRRK